MRNQPINLTINAIFLIVLFLISATVFVVKGQDFKVTNAVLKAVDANPKGQCPEEIKFRGSITTNGAGIVKYAFVRNDGASSPTFQLKFAKAGTLEIETSWMLGMSYKGYQSVKVLAPNELESNRQTGSFFLSCGEQDTSTIFTPKTEKVEIFCPVRQIRAEVTTSLHDSWWQTPQIGSLQSVSVESIGGLQTLVCKYSAYGTNVGIMRRFPEGKSNCEADRDYFVCW